MTARTITFRNGRVFDGRAVLWTAARFEDGRLVALGPDLPPGERDVDVQGDILTPGYVDLQVNGGGGVLFNDAPNLAGVRQIAEAHWALGVRQVLPTLITDTRDVTQAAIAAVAEAVAEGVPGVAGLHLEGPHLSVARKGAHAADLIRSMEPADLKMLLAAAKVVPVLKVTIAPENVTLSQVTTLTEAGVLVSLGHTDADFETCQRYVAAGARCVTHVFNAMSQLTARAPGLVGVALTNGAVSAGLIADGVHVHADAMRVAWASKMGPGEVFLVSDAMAVAGTSETSFSLNNRSILRRDGKLRLADGTLAGADLTLTRAVSVLVNTVGVDLAAALRAATVVPATLCGLPEVALAEGVTALDQMIRIKADLSGLVPLDL